MPILGEKGLSGIVKRFLDLVFIGGILICLSLPYSLKWYLERLNVKSSQVYWFLIVFLFVTGILCLLIVNEIRKVFKTLNRMNPFMMDNVTSLKKIAIFSFLIAASYVVKLIFYNSFFTVIIAMVFVIAGLFSIIFAEVFRQAVIVKEENDLTI